MVEKVPATLSFASKNCIMRYSLSSNLEIYFIFFVKHYNIMLMRISIVFLVEGHCLIGNIASVVNVSLIV